MTGFRALVPFALAAGLLLVGCTTVRTTSPSRSAAQELLITTAADRAAERLAQQLPPRLDVYVDASGVSGDDAQYAVATIEDQLMRRGLRLASDRNKAEAVLLVRSGALSTDEKTTLLGLPSFGVPVLPVGTVLPLPEINLFKHAKATGVAKLAATAYDPRTGRLLVSTDPQFGFAVKSDWVVLFLFSWSKQDIMPPDARRRETAIDKK